MQNNNVSLDALKGHLFEAIEGIKNLSDPMASENEKMSLEQAKAIVGVSSQIIDIYKTQIEAVKVFASRDDQASTGTMLEAIGITSKETIKEIGY